MLPKLKFARALKVMWILAKWILSECGLSWSCWNKNTEKKRKIQIHGKTSLSINDAFTDVEAIHAKCSNSPPYHHGSCLLNCLSLVVKSWKLFCLHVRWLYSNVNTLIPNVITWWLAERRPLALVQVTRGGGFPGAKQLSSRFWPSWTSAIDGWMLTTADMWSAA